MDAMRRPTWTETLLLVLLGAVAAAYVCRDGSLVCSEAFAADAPGSNNANGVIALVANDANNERLYLIETGRKRICIYRWLNPGLRLVAARSYDYDLEILDSAGDKMIEGKGATRGYVKATVEAERRAHQLKPVNN